MLSSSSNPSSDSERVAFRDRTLVQPQMLSELPSVSLTAVIPRPNRCSQDFCHGAGEAWAPRPSSKNIASAQELCSSEIPAGCPPIRPACAKQQAAGLAVKMLNPLRHAAPPLVRPSASSSS